MRLMMGVGLYSCVSDERSSPAPKTMEIWSPLVPPLRLRGLGTGVMNDEGRRPSTGGCSSGCPS